jgi:hypothetical protein
MISEALKTIGAIFRIRRLMRIEQTAKRVTEDVDAHNRRLNGTPPQYNDSRSPDGDDYNILLQIIDLLRRA